MAEKKHSILAVLEILRKYSDEDHILSSAQINEYLVNEYDLKLERRTLYANLEILRDFGYDISNYEDNHTGYYLIDRQFDKAEILLLCNAIHSSHIISSKQSDDLIRKLLATQSKYEAKEFSDKVYMPNPLKTTNKQLLFTISSVAQAIRDNKKMSFTYLHYDHNKQLVPRREEPYIVEPRYIVYADSRAYMIVTSDNHKGFIHYRLDRIKDAKVLTEKSKRLSNRQDAYEYARNKLFMYAGETSYVTFRCKERIMDQMIDIFGPELNVMYADDDHFIIRVKTSETGAIFLAQQYLDSIMIVEPEELRNKFISDLSDRLKDYKKIR